MWLLAIGIFLFIGVHLMTALPRRRNRLIKKYGEKNYKLGFSVTAILGLITIIAGYGLAREGAPILYQLPFELRPLALILTLLAFIFLVAARLKGHIRWWVRHPQVWAIKIWAFAHLLVNSDLASVMLFGSFLAWAIFDRISLNKRAQFGLIRTRDFDPDIKFDVLNIVIAVALYGAFAFYLHHLLIGVPVM